MVFIRKVEIFGFKSFGFKNTIVDFQPGLISVSGPNGSGKSNILDAIIFAMGENRPKILRVDKLKSLLHDTDGARHGPKMIRVNVHFDNSDRRIPVDTNTVEITREMDNQGDNHYYLNKKKTNRSHILDLLDMANAGLNQLNAVQQGTVTRISEFSAEEKRMTIEDIVGLSYFDEKKSESEKQLDEADRRLEIALARMDEIKKRIDELEEERNLKLRYDLLGKELNRLNAVVASNKLKIITTRKESKEKELDMLNSQMIILDKKRTEIRIENNSLDIKKSKFMEKVNAYNQTKSVIDTELAKAMQNFEESNTGILVTKKQIEQINSRIPQIHQQIKDIDSKRNKIASEISEIKIVLEQSNLEKNQINEEIKNINSKRNIILTQQTNILKKKSIFDEKIKDLDKKLIESQLRFSKLQSEQSNIAEKISNDSSIHINYQQESTKLLSLQTQLESKIKNYQITISETKSKLLNLNAKKEKIEKDIDDLDLILEKSSKAANQYDTKIRLVKEIMHEDYSIAKLKENAKKLGILGLVYDLISWDKKYERAILAVSFDWIKAIVVQDFASLVSLAEYVKYKKLPKIKIIPLEAIPKFKLNLPDQKGILGILSDYIKCDARYVTLKTFLFSNIILVNSRESAHRMSKLGYRSVTLDGQFFESQATAVVIDINSKISKLTRIISMSTSVDGLLASITILKKHIQKKKNTSKNIDESLKNHYEKLKISENCFAVTYHTHNDLKWQIDTKLKIHKQITAKISKLKEKKEYLQTEITKQESYISSLNQRISLVRENYSDEELQSIANNLNTLDTEKSTLETKQTDILYNYRDITSKLAKLDAQDTKETITVQNLDVEKNQINIQKHELESRIEHLNQEKETKSRELIKLRQKEQELIAMSGTSVSEVKQYDDKLRSLSDQDKTMTKDINKIERQIDSCSRDMQDLGEKQTQIKKILTTFGFKDTKDDFNVEPILHALDIEQRTLTELNAKAPETYIEVSNGYRLMSIRKNSLEEERNSIVRFIEDIEKDKKQTFLNAFDKVDKEIRNIFTKMTNGNAWLEIQNEDDIFNSGISYMIQFQHKSKRESTSISGGEKTLAAIVFVLALQKLKPSPFYLFDEVDAHLDAPNTEKLSKILAERSIENQFIMVSLKDSVVEKAKLIYGVFSKNGSSQVVTYKDKRLLSLSADKSK